MATTLASLVVRIGADVTGVTAGLSTLDKRVRSIKRQFGSVKDSTLTWQGALTTLAGAAGLALASSKVFELGADVEETASKFNTVFGPSVKGAQKFLDDFANTAGLTINQGRELLSTTGAITQGLGFTQTASAGLSEQIVRLAGDIASFNNTQGGAERVTRSIISALNGETESLKESANVVVLQADVMAKAAEMTGKATSEITRQDRALATLALISDRAGVAIGDLARTMDSPANRARKLVAQVLTLRDSIAHALLPAMTVVLEELAKVGGSEGFQGLGDKIATSSNIIAAWAKFAVEAFKTVALAIAAPVRIAFNLGEIIGKILTAAVQAMKGDFEAAGETVKSILGDFGDMGEAITSVVSGFDDMRVASGIAWETVSTGAEDAAAAVAETAVSVGTLNREVPQLATGFQSTIQPLATTAVRLHDVNQQAQQSVSTFSQLSGVLGRLSGLFGAFGFALPGFGQIQAIASFAGGFASGGTIPSGQWGVVGERGPEIVSGPATVTPSAGAAPAFTINVPEARDPITLARDRQWMTALHEMMQQLKHNGYRFA